MTMTEGRLAAAVGAGTAPWALAPGEADERHEVAGLAGAFHLHYQPEVRLADRAVTGCEALLRWDHPISGVIPPGQMLAECDELPGVAALGVWTIYAAARQAARWRAEGLDVQVTVNLAAHQVADPELLARLHRAVVCTGLPAGALGVDLPAELLAADGGAAVARAARAIVELGGAVAVQGITVPVDAEALAGVPAAALKVGRPVGGVERYCEEVAAVLPVARALGAEVVAERVETADELAALAALGCDRAFGHGVARPGPAAEITPLLHRA